MDGPAMAIELLGNFIPYYVNVSKPSITFAHDLFSRSDATGGRLARTSVRASNEKKQKTR